MARSIKAIEMSPNSWTQVRLTRQHRRVSLSSDGDDQHLLALRFHGDEVLVAAQGLRSEAHHVLAAHPGRHDAALARKPP